MTDLDYHKEQLGVTIICGRVYRYLLDLPAACKGGLYRVERFILDVPSYTEKVLVHCIQGKDRGLWFSCSPQNFVLRYEPMEDAPVGNDLNLSSGREKQGR